MTTITPPDNYSTIKRPCIFSVTRDTDNVADIIINGSLKQMRGRSLSINVARFFDQAITPMPMPRPTTGYTINGILTADRAVKACITVDGVTSNSIFLMAADKPIAEDRILSDLKHRQICRGQVDEISVNLQSPARIEWLGNSVDLKAGVSIITLRIPTTAPHTFTVTLKRTIGPVLDSIEYDVADMVGTPLCWLNAYGAIDFWNFSSPTKLTTKATKIKIYTNGGHAITSRQAEDTIAVHTRPLPQMPMAALCQILTSEAVWLVSSEAYIPIDIITDSAETYVHEAVGSLKLEFRPKKRRI